MSIDFLVSDSPKSIQNIISLYALKDDRKFDIRHAEHSTEIIVPNVDLETVLVVMRDTPYTTSANLRVYDPHIDIDARYDSEVDLRDERVKRLVDAFYDFVRWVRRENRLIEPVGFQHSTDGFQLDMLDAQKNEIPHRYNTTCHFFIPNEVPESFITWWNREKNVHPGYDVNGFAGDSFLPGMWVIESGEKSYDLILYGVKTNKIRALVNLLEHGRSEMEVSDHGRFAKGEMIALNHGLLFQFWGFRHVSYGKFFMLELYERIKERWPETKIEKGDWLNRQLYKLKAQTRQEKINKEWYFNSTTNIFIGMAQNYFEDQGMEFTRRGEKNKPTPKFEGIDVMGADYPDVNEMALLSHTYPDEEREMLIHAKVKPSGRCAIIVISIDQGWHYLQPKWDKFIDYLADEGWQISTEQTKVVDKLTTPLVYSQRQPEYDGAGVITIETLRQFFPNENEERLKDLQFAQKVSDVYKLTQEQYENRADMRYSLSTYKRRKAELAKKNLLRFMD